LPEDQLLLGLEEAERVEAAEFAASSRSTAMVVTRCWPNAARFA
jgi:hypothetical protein